MTQPVIDAARFRQVLGHLPTGVCVVSGLHNDEPVGMVIGSFFSVSLNPPLVGFCAGSSSSTWTKLRQGPGFCASVLAADQERISRALASKDPDKFAGIGWRRSPRGMPILDGAIAWIDCALHDVHVAGDHEVVIGQVHDLDLHLDVASERAPLLFFRGGYGLPGPS